MFWCSIIGVLERQNESVLELVFCFPHGKGRSRTEHTQFPEHHVLGGRISEQNAERAGKGVKNGIWAQQMA
jgi:hypothetical protein